MQMPIGGFGTFLAVGDFYTLSGENSSTVNIVANDDSLTAIGEGVGLW